MEKGIDKIKLVVYKEHTLGYIDPKLPNVVNILHSSPLKGSPRVTGGDGFHINNESEIRLASEKDFDEFRVSFKGFDNSELYEFKQSEAKDIVGKISFYGFDGNIDKVVDYTDKESYLSALKKEMNYNISGFEYKTMTSDPEIRKSVDDIIYGAYGADNPHTLEWYSSKIKNNPDAEKKISEIHIFSLKEGGMAIDCKINGERQEYVKMSREDVNGFNDKTDTKKLIEKYFADVLSKDQSQTKKNKGEEKGFTIPNSIKGVNLTEEQKSKLASGEEVFLKGMISSQGKKFSNIMFLDKGEMKIKFKPAEKGVQGKSMYSKVNQKNEVDKSKFKL